MESIKGIAVSPGVIIGRVFILDDEFARIARRTVAPEATSREIQRLDAALDRSVVELAQLKDQTREDLGE